MPEVSVPFVKMGSMDAWLVVRMVEIVTLVIRLNMMKNLSIMFVIVKKELLGILMIKVVPLVFLKLLSVSSVRAQSLIIIIVANANQIFIEL